MNLRHEPARATARFWEWTGNGWCRMALRPGQTLRWSHGARHEEGWFRTVITWSRTSHKIQRVVYTSGVDCDGYGSEEIMVDCDLERIAANDPRDARAPEIRNPAWQRGSHRVVDQAAEAAGY